MTISLSTSSLPLLPEHLLKPSYDRSKVVPGIAHIGVGAFHRAHQAVYVDRCLSANSSQDSNAWGILGVGLLHYDQPIRDALAAQDYLYTVNERASDGGSSTRVIGAIVDFVYAPGNSQAVLKRLSDPSIKIVSMTITEGGYLMDTAGQFMTGHPSIVRDLQNPEDPSSVFGFVVGALDMRRRANIAPFTVMSCDNVRHNGDTAKKAFMAFARARDSSLAEWIEQHVSFPNSMVDRISPAMTPAVRERLSSENQCADLAPVICEDFIQWVLEDNFCNGRPDWSAAGVMLTEDVTPYEEAKIRLLNACHLMLSYPSFMSGLRQVDVAVRDPLFNAYLADFLEDAGAYLSDLPGMQLSAYKKKLLSRFSNPAIGDQLARLCLDGGSKIPGFILATLNRMLEQESKCPSEKTGDAAPYSRLAFLLACYNVYIKSNADELGQTYTLQEPNAMSVLQPIIDSADPMQLLRTPLVVGSLVATHDSFTKLYCTYVSSITKNGTRHTLAAINAAAHPACQTAA